MSQPVVSAAVSDKLQQVPQGLASSAPPTTSGALPMLTPLQDPQPSAQASVAMSAQPAQAMPQASPRIKPPPASGSFPHSQAGTPLWQMLGAASNMPGLGAGMFTGKESLDLDVLAKAAVQRRKEQVLLPVYHLLVNQHNVSQYQVSTDRIQTWSAFFTGTMDQQFFGSTKSCLLQALVCMHLVNCSMLSRREHGYHSQARTAEQFLDVC